MLAIARDRGKLVRIICTIALLCIGFAHRAPSVDAAPHPSEIAAYTLPDGSVPVICLSGHTDEADHHGHDGLRDCDACRISNAIALPEPVQTAGLPAYSSADVHRPVRHEAFYRQLFTPDARPRAPPASFFA